MKDSLSMEDLEQVSGGKWFDKDKDKDTVVKGPKCMCCGSTRTQLKGTNNAGREEYKCLDCGNVFYLISANMFKA